MGLMVLGRDADAPAADDLLEDLAESCLCEHTAGDHTPEGCRACLCPAIWDGLGAEDLEDVELEVDAARVTAVLVAARKRRRLLDDERRDREAKDPDSLPRSNRPKMVKRKPAAEPKAPSTGSTKGRGRDPEPTEVSTRATSPTRATRSGPTGSHCTWTRSARLV